MDGKIDERVGRKVNGAAKRADERVGVGPHADWMMCVGGGMGAAGIFERV